MRAVFLNDQPYASGIEDPHEALGQTLAFSVDDWGSTRAMAWVWGIVEGWDDEAMAELAAEFKWDAATTARLNRLHAAFEARGALSTAWEAAESALPEGWRLYNLIDEGRTHGYPDPVWRAIAVNKHSHAISGTGPTPAAALAALTARLQARSTEPKP